ncbi:MAG TPA: hypothetical protein VGJ93_09110 [Desulfuromonadaceae bacterium]|jgi:hypothetical protein
MKKLQSILFILLAVLLITAVAYAETRTYTEIVTVKIEDDEYNALNKAKEQAKEQALRSYLNDVYKDRSTTLNLTGDDRYIQDLEVIESSVSGTFAKELKAKIKITINEEEVRAYLKRQGAVTGKNEDRRIIVMLIPGKMDSGDAPVILDNVRAEVRRSLTAAEYTVIDSDDQAIQDALTEEADYNKMLAHMNKLTDQLADKGEWLILGKVDMDIVPNGNVFVYRAMMTGKAVSVANRDILWEGNLDGAARAPKSEAKAALRLSAINGGKALAKEVLGALNTKALTQERRGTRFEIIFASGGDYNLERKILKLLKEDIKGLKNVSQKNRGKGDMVVDLMYVGKISDLVDLLLDNFEKDSQMKVFSPQIAGNKVVFKK